MNDKVKAWRSSRLHRKCVFCQHLKFHPAGVWRPTYDYYKCMAKDKIISDCLPDLTKVPRLFCKLFELKVEEE